MRAYWRECHNFFCLFYLLFLSSHNTSHSLSLSLRLLIFVFSIPLPQHVDLTKDHHTTPSIFVPGQNSTPRTLLRTRPDLSFKDEDDDSSVEILCATNWVRLASLGNERVGNANESHRSKWIGLRRGFWGLRDGEDEQMPEIGHWRSQRKRCRLEKGLLVVMVVLIHGKVLNFWVEKIWICVCVCVLGFLSDLGWVLRFVNVVGCWGFIYYFF